MAKQSPQQYNPTYPRNNSAFGDNQPYSSGIPAYNGVRGHDIMPQRNYGQQPVEPTGKQPPQGGGVTPPVQDVQPSAPPSTYDSIMSDFSGTNSYQQQDYSQVNDNNFNPNLRGMNARAGSYLPELDYIPEARKSSFGDFSDGANGRDLNDVSTAQEGRQRAETSLYDAATSRLDPRFEQEQKDLQIDLRNRGLKEGDAAYDAAVDNFGRSKNDAYQQAQYSSVNNAGAESQRDFGMDAQRRAQMFGEQMGMSQDEIQRLGTDMARQQLIQQRANADQQLGIQDQQLMMQGDAQLFDQEMGSAGYKNSLRQQQIQEDMLRRNQSLNELNALISGSQVSAPNFSGYNQAGNAGGVDYSGAAGQQYDSSIDKFNARQGQFNSLMQGGSSAAGIYGMFSDERLKFEIVKIGDYRGINFYKWTWNNLMPEAFKRGLRGVGVLAQEIEKIMPNAIIEDASGYKKVDYNKVFERILS